MRGWGTRLAAGGLMTLAVAGVWACRPVDRTRDPSHPYMKQYGGREDCRGTSGTECFQVLARWGHDPRRVCRAESPLPANRRRMECYQAFGARDGETVAVDRLVHEIRTGRQPREAVYQLFHQGHAGDGESIRALGSLLDDPLAFGGMGPRAREAERALVAGVLAGLGDRPAFEMIVGRLTGARPPPEGERADDEAWLMALTRRPTIERMPIGPALLAVIARGDSGLTPRALAVAASLESVSARELLRALILGARPAGGARDLARRFIRDGLAKDPAGALEALAALVHDPDVGRYAAAILEHVAGDRKPDAAVRFGARARRLLYYFPGLEDPAQLRARRAEDERIAVAKVTVVGLFAPSGPGQDRVIVLTDRHLELGEESAVILRLTRPGGRTVGAVTTETRPAAPPQCSAPTHCIPNPTEPPSPHFEFSAESGDGPLLDARGAYILEIESTFGTLRYGPVRFSVP